MLAAHYSSSSTVILNSASFLEIGYKSVGVLPFGRPDYISGELVLKGDAKESHVVYILPIGGHGLRAGPVLMCGEYVAL